MSGSLLPVPDDDNDDEVELTHYKSNQYLSSRPYISSYKTVEYMYYVNVMFTSSVWFSLFIMCSDYTVI